MSLFRLLALSLDHRLAIGDGNCRSRDVAPIIARTQNEDRGNFLCLSRAFHWDLLAKTLTLIGRPGGRNERRPNGTESRRELARMPCPASSCARPAVKFTFVVAKASKCGLGLSAFTEAALMI